MLKVIAELLRKKSAFLFLLQMAVINVILFYFCRAIFPVDFAAFDALFGGVDTGKIWILLTLAFIVYLAKITDKPDKIVYIRLPALAFISFSALALLFSSMGIWFFGILLIFSGFIWLLQVIGVNYTLWLSPLFFLLNIAATLLLYVDQLHYFLTREHLNIYYIRILRTFNAGFFESLSNAGVTPFMYLLPVAILLATFILCYPVLRYGPVLELPQRRSYPVLLFALFIPLYFQFHLFAADIPINEYMNFRLRNFWFTIPDPPLFKSSQHTRPVFPVGKDKLTEKDFARQAEFSWLNVPSEKNLVIIVLESMRQDYFVKYMPRTMALASEGIQCFNHLSNANDTEGSLLSLYYGVLPLVFQRSEYEDKPSAWLEFMKTSGYELMRISGSSGSLFYPDYRYVHFREYFRQHGLKAPSKTTYDENSRFQCEAAIHKLKNTDRKCIVELYLFHMHYPFWYPEQYEKYTPILNDNSEILTLAFPELAKRLANRYRNSTLFTDEVLSDFILRLKTEGLLENTLVVIMGDHGEMLGEDGKLFHANGSEFIQYNTPFVILGADVLPGKVTKVTSHVDIIPTLGSLLGFTASGAYGKDFLGNIDGGAVTFDLSGPGRITFRDRKFASMFYWSGGLSWILSCGADCRIDEKLEQYYTPQNLGISFSIAREHGRQLQELLTR